MTTLFQALHTALLETAGDSPENIRRDREEADIIVDTDKEPSVLLYKKDPECPDLSSSMGARPKLETFLSKK